MHEVLNQPQGMIEMPGEHRSFNSYTNSDQDQTLAMTLDRLAQGDSEPSLADSSQETDRLISDEIPQQLSGMEIVFADSVRLELELAAEMASLLHSLQKAKLKKDSRKV